MKVSVYVSNLGKYNEGILNGHWTALPVKDVNRDILDQLDLGKDSQGNYCHDWFISDYEAPFRIDQYADLYELNKLAEKFEEYDTIEEVFDALDDKENLSVPVTYDFDEQTLNEILSGMKPAEIACTVFFGKVKDWQDDYLYFDGYGNLASMTESEYQEALKDNSDWIIKKFKEENL